MEPLTPRALTWRSDEYEEERAAGATTAGGAEAALALRAGLHETLAARSALTSGRCKVPGKGSGASALRASRAGLDDVAHMRGELRIPATGELPARNATPAQVFDELMKWFERERRRTTGGCSR